jgi:hypothetical protein
MRPWSVVARRSAADSGTDRQATFDGGVGPVAVGDGLPEGDEPPDEGALLRRPLPGGVACPDFEVGGAAVPAAPHAVRPSTTTMPRAVAGTERGSRTGASCPLHVYGR